RKLEKEFALHGGAPATNESDEYEEDHEESEPIASVNGTTKYDNGDMQVTVTTSEISREDKDNSSEKTQAAAPRLMFSQFLGGKFYQGILPLCPRFLLKSLMATSNDGMGSSTSVLV
ncbi:hypothetical protein D5086_007977, partial [Populus alba]